MIMAANGLYFALRNLLTKLILWLTSKVFKISLLVNNFQLSIFFYFIFFYKLLNAILVYETMEKIHAHAFLKIGNSWRHCCLN